VTASRPLAVDLGSAHLGVVAGVVDAGALRVTYAKTRDLADEDEAMTGAERLRVRAAAIGDTVDGLVAVARVHGADLLVVEHGNFYAPRMKPGQSADAYAKMLQAMQAAWTVTHDLAVAIVTTCAELEPPIPVTLISRASWAARICAQRVGHGSATSAQAREAVTTGLDEASLACLLDGGDKGQHKRDALGAMRGALWTAPTRSRGARKPTGRKVGRPRGSITAEDSKVRRYRPGKARGSRMEARVLATLAGGPLTSGQIVVACGKGAPSVLAGLCRRGALTQAGRGEPYALALA
jgi:hypothetical protein